MGFLHPSTNELVNSAMSKLQKGEATSVPVAVRKAIVGRGITAQADLKRRTKEVLSEMGRRSGAARRARKVAEEESEKLAKRLSK